MERGLQKILDRIDSEASKEEEDILRKADEEAKAIIEQAKKEAAKEAADIMKNYHEKAERTNGMVKASSRISSKMRRLKAENNAIEKAFEQAKEKLAAFKKTKGYRKFLEKEITQSLNGMEKKGVQLLAAKDDQKIFSSTFLKSLRKKTGMKIELAKEPNEMLGGVIILFPDEGIELNRSFEAKLAYFREQKISEVARIIYPKGT